MNSTLTTQKKNFILVKLSDWQRLHSHLSQLRHALAVITRGDNEMKNGTIIRAKNITEALKIYGGKRIRTR